MLQFFRVNAYYQIFSLLILLVLVRLPAFLYNLPLLNPEMNWLLIGEQVASGNLLYADIIDNIGPFSGFIYGIIHFFAGRSVFTYHIIAFFITAIQIFYFTLMAHNRGLFKEKNYVPGLFLILFYSLSFDFFTLSPALMGTTFLLFAFGSFLSQIERHGTTDDVFEIGVLIGVAFLFYPPFFIFFLWILVSLNLFTGAKLRQQFLVIFGMLFPLIIISIWYFINGHFDDLSTYFILPIFDRRQFILNDFRGLIISFILPLAISILGFFRVLATSKYSNFQTRAQQIMLLWFLAAVLSILLMPFLAPMQFIPFVIPITYFNILFFASIKKKWIAELAFLLVFIGVLFINFQGFIPQLAGVSLPKLDKLRLLPVQNEAKIVNKNILVLGNNMAPYMKNKAATSFINWALSKNYFSNTNNYNNLVKIMENFEKGKPQYIFDQENLMPEVFQKIPEIERQYKKIDTNLYELVKN